MYDCTEASPEACMDPIALNKARQAALSPARRREIATKAALARWKKDPKATQDDNTIAPQTDSLSQLLALLRQRLVTLKGRVPPELQPAYRAFLDFATACKD